MIPSFSIFSRWLLQVCLLSSDSGFTSLTWNANGTMFVMHPSTLCIMTRNVPAAPRRASAPRRGLNPIVRGLATTVLDVETSCFAPVREGYRVVVTS